MVEIAGNKTDEDWRWLETKISADFENDELWNKALNIFEERLNERYIKPIK